MLYFKWKKEAQIQIGTPVRQLKNVNITSSYMKYVGRITKITFHSYLPRVYIILAVYMSTVK